MIEKESKTRRGVRAGRSAFLILFTHFTRCINKSERQNSKQLEFETIFEKVILEPLKKSETFTNRSGLKNQYQRWV